MDKITLNMLAEIADLHRIPEGAFSLRENGQSAQLKSSENIIITKKTDKPGIDIVVKPGTRNESCHIPVVISESGITEVVYNDFYIGEDSDVLIVAGCGIHNCGTQLSQHDGVHTFHVGKNARVKYVEKHYGEGDGIGGRVLNPTTVVELEEGSYLEMETTQIKGVDSTVRRTSGRVGDRATFIVKEKIMTHGEQYAETDFTVDLDGEDSSADVVSRSVARDVSRQFFASRINGNNRCAGHSECDAIIMDDACVSASPALDANNVEASLIHEAAIGKIAGEQLIKLMTLGLTEEEAEEQIIAGFLK